MWEKVVANLKPTGVFWRRTCAASGWSRARRNLAGADGGRRGAATPGRSRNRGVFHGRLRRLGSGREASGLVAGLALINSQAAGDTEEARQGRRAMIEKVRKEGTRAATDAAVPKLFANPQEELSRYALKGRNAPVSRESRGRWRRWRGGRTAHRCCGNSASPSSSCTARRTNLFLRRARELATSLKAKYVEIEGAGHCTPLEAPDKVAAAIKDFADGH